MERQHNERDDHGPRITGARRTWGIVLLVLAAVACSQVQMLWRIEQLNKELIELRKEISEHPVHILPLASNTE